MEKDLLLSEELNRINFLMNFNSSKVISEQKINSLPTNILNEAPPQKKPQQQELTPEQIKNAKQKIQAAANKTAYTIFGELMKAFDMDGDKNLKDNDGTNEGAALAAIKKIKNKETLDALNKYIANWKQYPNLKSWLNAEMSDFDSEYGDIWNKLEKMGYAGANRNILLKYAGETGVGQLVKGADKAIDALRSMTIEQIMEGFRSFLGGAAGGAVQILLTVFAGPLGAGINIFAWSALLIWDIYKWVQGDPNWWNLILDTFSVVTAGIAAKSMAAANAVGKEAGKKGLPALFSALKSKFPKIFEYLSKFGKTLASYGAKATKAVQSAIGWLKNKIPWLSSVWKSFNNAVAKIGDLFGKIDESITGVMGGNVVVNVRTKLFQTLEKISPKFGAFLNSPKGVQFLKELPDMEAKAIEEYIAGPLRGKTAQYSQDWVCKNGTTKQCQLFKASNEYYKKTVAVTTAGKSGTDINKTRKDVTKTATNQIQNVATHASDIKGAEEEVVG